MLTRSPVASEISFQAVNWFSNPSKDSSIMTKSSAYSSSHGDPRRQSYNNASITITNTKGLRAEPWWTPTLTPSFSLKLLYILRLGAASACIARANLNFHSWTPSFHIAHPPDGFSRHSRKPFWGLQNQNRVVYVFWDVCPAFVTENMESMVPLPGMKPCCISLILLSKYLMMLSMTRSMNFITWSNCFSPR